MNLIPGFIINLLFDQLRVGKQSLTPLPLVTHICISRWIRPALVQIMACCLFGAKPLSQPMLAYCQLHFGTNFGEFLSKNLSFTKIHLKISSTKWRPFCPGGDELIHWIVFKNQKYIFAFVVISLHTVKGAAYWNGDFWDILRPEQNGHHFTDNIFNCIFFKKKS